MRTEHSVRHKIDSPEDVLVAKTGVKIIHVREIKRFCEGDRYSTLEEIETIFTNAWRNKGIKKIVFVFRCPGGPLEGVSSLANYIYQLRETGEKEIFTISDSEICSAGYWLAAACGKIYLGSQTANVGSIGFRVESRPKTDEVLTGDEITLLQTVGVYKNAWDPKNTDPSCVKFRDETLLYLHGVFVADIAKFRGVSIAEVQALADGREFYGQDAIDKKLADGFYDIFEWKYNHNLVAKI